MARLEAKERQMLWLAYAEGRSHDEIGEIVGFKAVNVRTLLFRARRRLAGILGGGNGRG